MQDKLSEQEACVKIITSKDPLFPDLVEAWHHRQLAWMLAKRNIKVRYKQTVLGSTWIIIQPLLLSGMLTLVLGVFLSVPSGGLPYALFALTGTAFWSAFSRGITETSISLATSGNIILKVYFPRILIPVATTLTVVLDFLPIYAVVIAAVLAYGLLPGWPVLLSPLFVILTFSMAFAVGIWVTMLDAVYRDMRLVIPSILQLLFYGSPVMYAESVIPVKWRALYHFNPIVGLLDGFRWSLVAGATPPSVAEIEWSAGLTIILLVSGLSVFARLERFAVDRI
jgi:lipopolysaccharide transport system permease protein